MPASSRSTRREVGRLGWNRPNHPTRTKEGTEDIMATATTIAQQLGTVRATLQQVITDYATVQLTQQERQRLNEDLVGIRAVLNSVANLSNGAGK